MLAFSSLPPEIPNEGDPHSSRHRVALVISQFEFEQLDVVWSMCELAFGSLDSVS